MDRMDELGTLRNHEQENDPRICAKRAEERVPPTARERPGDTDHQVIMARHGTASRQRETRDRHGEVTSAHRTRIKVQGLEFARITNVSDYQTRPGPAILAAACAVGKIRGGPGRPLRRQETACTGVIHGCESVACSLDGRSL